MLNNISISTSVDSFAPIAISQNTINSENTSTVNARELCSFLNIKRDFSDWIKRQLSRANLLENLDYLVSYMNVENPKGGRPACEYFLTLDSAKHICMMSQSLKGQELRKYFIEFEKQHRNNSPMLDLNNPEFLRTALLSYTEKVSELTQENSSLKYEREYNQPKVEYHDKFMEASGAIYLRSAAAALGVGAYALRDFLIANKIMFAGEGKNSGYIPYSPYRDNGKTKKGLFIVKHSSHLGRVYNTLKVTAKGLQFIARKMGLVPLSMAAAEQYLDTYETIEAREAH